MFALIIAYVVSVHLAVAWHSWQLQALAVSLVFAIALYGALTAFRLWAWLLLLLVVIGSLWFARTVGAEVLLYIPPVLMPLMLLAVFAPSLRRGKTPVVSQVALAIRGDLPDELKQYTRRVTQLWAFAFAVMAAVHLLLAIGAPRELWSLVTNFVSYAVVGLLFLLEHLYHRWRYAQFWHPTFLQFLRGMTKVDYRNLGNQ